MNQKSCLFLIVAILAILMGYVGSYLRYTAKYGGYHSVRICDYAWMTSVYRPLVLVEELATGEDITLATWEDIELSTE